MAESAHCSCCHACHVSMKQRPRPLLACSTCTSIYCRICLETRFRTDRWAEGLAEAQWVCPKCVGDCVCKACAKAQGRPAPAAAPRKRPLPSAAADDDDLYREDDLEDVAVAAMAAAEEAMAHADADDESERFFAPTSRAVRRAVPDVLSGRQPALPKDFVPSAPPPPALNVSLPKETVGLGGSMMFRDANTPMHRKALELSRQKERCEATIRQMQGLLTMLQHEREVLDQSLNDLIKKTTAQVNIPRTASMAQFEDLLLSPTSRGALRRSNSSCNMEAESAAAEAANRKLGF